MQDTVKEMTVTHGDLRTTVKNVLITHGECMSITTRGNRHERKFAENTKI